MRPKVLILSIAVLFAAYANPFTNIGRACTQAPPEPDPPPTPKPVWLVRLSPTQVSITVSELTKSASPGLPSNGCACAFRNLASLTSIDDVQFEFADGKPIPDNLWSWGSAPAAGGAWSTAAGGGSWTSFKGCNCGLVPEGTGFSIKFLATVQEATTTDAIEADLLAASSLLGTDTTDDFAGVGGPSNGTHQAFWSASVVEQHLPHFTTINIFEQDVFGDSGPVDTVALGIGPGPFLYEAIPAGQDLDGMITEDLPVGLSIDPNTGAISGTPTICEIRHVACILTDPKTKMPWDILWWKIIIDDGTIPHFSTIDIVTFATPSDTGPVNTDMFEPPGPYRYEAVPAGQQSMGMTTQDVPDGLALDPDTGALFGVATQPGVFHVLCVVTRKKTWEVVALLWWKIIVDDGSIPHFKDVHFITTGEPVDTGPVDEGVFDPPGPYSFEVVTAGQTVGEIVTDDVPMGLSIDPDTGAVTGIAKWPGKHHVLCVVTRKGTWEVVAFLWWDFVIEGPHIPAVSQWGLMVMTLLALTAGTVVIGRRRLTASA